MTTPSRKAPEMTMLICGCGHPETAHAGAPLGCKSCAGCGRFRPRPASIVPNVVTAPAPAPAASPTPQAEALIKAGKRSQSKRTAALALKVEHQLAELLELVRDERRAAEAKEAEEKAAAEARAEIARLEQELAAARAKLPTAAPRAPRRGAGRTLPRDKKCPDCGREGLANLGVHQRTAHGALAAAT